MRARRLVPAVLPGALAAFSGTGLLAVSGWLITEASLRPPVLSLTVAIGAVQAFSLARGIFRYLQRLGVHGLSLRALGELRLRLFDLLEPRVPGSVGGAGAARALSGLVSDADEVAQGFAKRLGAWVDFTASALAGTVVAALVLPVLGLVVLAAALVVLVATGALAGAGARAGAEAAAQRATLAALVVETVRAAPELVAYGREDLVEGRLAEVRRRSGALALRAALVYGLARAAAVVATGAGVTAVVGVGLVAHEAGHLSGPLLATVAFATLAALDQCAALPGALAGAAAGRASAARIEALAALPAVAEPPVGAAAPSPAEPAPLRAGLAGTADLEDAGVALPGGGGLAGVSLHLAAGRSIALRGESGAGKTTVVNALMHFVELTAGRAVLEGEDVSLLGRPDIARRAAWLPDETHLFAASLADNLRTAAPGASEAECLGALDRAGLGAWAASLPAGLATALGAGGRPVSAGERQRLGMARALLAGAPVLLLDEPTSRLDRELGAQVLAGLLRSAHGRSVLVVSHEDAVDDLVDEVVVLAGGRVLSRSEGGCGGGADRPS